METMFYIGNFNYVRKDMIVTIGAYNVSENKRRCKEANSNSLLADYSCGKKKESVIFLSNGEVYISPILLNNLINDYNLPET